MQCTHLSRSYGEVDVLREVDLVIRRDDHVAVRGVSGSGKSTLLHVLGLLDSPTSGTYTLFGQDPATWSHTRRARVRGRLFGFVFQLFHLMPHRTVDDNVAIGLLYAGVARSQWESRIAEVTDYVRLSHRRTALAATLSGGEQQRVAIARAIASRPAVLLCDEPTGSLDTGTAASVLDLLDDLHERGMTLIVVTHDEQVARRARRELHLVDGRFDHEGPT